MKKKKIGNGKPQTFRLCENCHVRYGPLDRLNKKFCSNKCKHEAQKTGRKTYRKTITKARSAQSLLAYHVNVGNIVRPSKCSQCGVVGKKIEGAHFNYDEPLRVRWLCCSCHRKWDKAEPKNATYRVKKETPDQAAGGGSVMDLDAPVNGAIG